MIKMKNKLIYAAAAILVASCSLNEPLEYENAPALYLPKNEFNYSFFYAGAELAEATVNITVHAMGKPSDVDRPFVLAQSNTGDADAASPATHYLAFSSDEMKRRMVMPAGSSEVEVPITLYKDASLELATVKLSIRCVENDNFSIGVTEMQKAVVTFSSQAIKPGNWADWYYAFGASWGSRKMRFIIDNTGITNFDTVPNDDDYLIYLNNKLKQKMYEYNTENPGAPLSEADGTRINFDNPYIYN